MSLTPLGRRTHKRRGMTILEVMISVMVLSIAFTGGYAMLLSSVDLNQTTRETNMAVFDLKATLEIVRSTPFDDITSEFPDGCYLFPDGSPYYAGGEYGGYGGYCEHCASGAHGNHEEGCDHGAHAGHGNGYFYESRAKKMHLGDERVMITYEDVNADPLVIVGEISWQDHRGKGETGWSYDAGTRRTVRMTTVRTR